MALTAQEQYMLELINRARLDPNAEAARLGIGLNDGLAPGTISSAAKQVLAPNSALETAATGHSQWMLANDTFSHTGAGGSGADDRIEAAGYASSGFWWGENLGQYLTTGTINLNQVTADLHEGLFLSEGHRQNIMRDVFREVGIGIETGTFTTNQSYNAALATQNYGQIGSAVFLTGVAYTDSDNDDFYSIGEGVANVSFQIGGSTAQTASAGGYGLSTSAGAAVSVTVTQGGSASAVTVDLSAGNVKLDLVDGSLFRTSGNLTLVSGVADAELLGVGNLSLTGNGQSNTLLGNKGSNTIDAGGGNDVVYDRGGNDNVDLGDGNDTVIVGTGADTLAGGNGIDNISYFGSTSGVNVDLFNNSVSGGWAAGDSISGFERVYGSNTGNDILKGTNGANFLRGYGGNDIVYDRGGDDNVDLGDGNDTVLVGNGADTLIGGNGIDNVNYYYSSGGVNVDLLTNALSGGWAADDTISGFERVYGSNTGNDILKGTNGANFLRGYGGNDVVYDRGGNDNVDLGDGNDTVIVGTGADTLAGGNGIDNISYFGSTSGVNVDLFNNSVSGGWAAGDSISGFERVYGSNTGNDILKGTNGANFLRGYGGNDIVYDRGGDDNVDLGDGNDTVLVGNGADTLIGGNGIDNVNYYYSSGGVNVDLLTNALSGGWAADDTISGFERVYGSNTGNDILKGTNGANFLRGYGGNDQIDGRAGNDNIDGGAGADTLTGGTGADHFVFDTGYGADLATDFSLAEGDRLLLDDDLWAGTLTTTEIVNTFASVVGTDVRLDFGGGDVLTLVDLADTAGLESHIIIV
ncbi:Bifunctional hemolysin/adenylate cyclase [Defluviimonas aquaemixtae]|uniref:Bifunctional hemolysin/adenylate cyclase n=1 Tax=Albidovulum aquaemixtae TaxID=1542388 RepID=A0A2R8B5H4_9RHOB|nr:CAP domain-containing protein [Defluviimonas aquaemixtae]SPH17888.1 Bifunctional hemolysin/adenylate cyclase [Defluviimonas aquaemixtae]